MSLCETYSGDSCAGDDVSEGGVAGRYGTAMHLAQSSVLVSATYIGALQAVGEANPVTSEVFESWRAKDPYGLLSSSSHMVG